MNSQEITHKPHPDKRRDARSQPILPEEIIDRSRHFSVNAMDGILPSKSGDCASIKYFKRHVNTVDGISAKKS